MADVGFSEGTQDSVANRVHERIGVGMAVQTLGMGYFHPAKDTFSAFHQCMNVVTSAHMNHAAG